MADIELLYDKIPTEQLVIALTEHGAHAQMAVVSSPSQARWQEVEPIEIENVRCFDAALDRLQKLQRGIDDLEAWQDELMNLIDDMPPPPPGGGRDAYEKIGQFVWSAIHARDMRRRLSIRPSADISPSVDAEGI